MSEMTRTTFEGWLDVLHGAIALGREQTAKLAARRLHRMALAMDQSLSDSWNEEGILCPTCGGNDWGAEFKGVASGPAIPMIDPINRIQARETLGPLVVEMGTARLVAIFCNGCNFYAPTDAAEYVRCPKDGRLVTLGDCCAGCGVHFSESCSECGQTGYHADECPWINPDGPGPGVPMTDAR